MDVIISTWKRLLSIALWEMSDKTGLDCRHISTIMQVETPPDPSMGDMAFPLFPFAKVLKKAPANLASGVYSKILDSVGLQESIRNSNQGLATLEDALALVNGRLGRVQALGPYLNVFLHRPAATAAMFAAYTEVLDCIDQENRWKRSPTCSGRRILLEFSSPNTNKPLHLGHLRNNSLGESMARIFRAAGAELKTVNLFNDRGIHICKSMLAYELWGNGLDPQVEGIKPDHFVAKLYVAFQNELKRQIAVLREADSTLVGKEDDDLVLQTKIGQDAQAMLLAWEQGDDRVRELWKKMNAWAIGGIMQTYTRTGIVFDWIQYEHETYLLGKAEVEKGLVAGAFKKRDDGAVVIDLPWKDGVTQDSFAQKVLLRADGTSIYLTQDLGTAIKRHETWDFDQAVYVVASEQDYHFKVLFHCLKSLGHEWAQNLHHLSYGLVNLPSGRMKTREGTVVDADLLIDELQDLALQTIKEKSREEAVGDPMAISEKVALGALHYYLLQASPTKDMIFDPEESLSFAGNTGPYLQYMGARISSMIRKWQGPLPVLADVDVDLLVSDQEWDLVRRIAAWPDQIDQAAKNYNPSVIASALYELAKSFSRFYHDLPIINADSEKLAKSRLFLSFWVLKVMRSGLVLLNIPFLEVM